VGPGKKYLIAAIAAKTPGAKLCVSQAVPIIKFKKRRKNNV